MGALARAEKHGFIRCSHIDQGFRIDPLLYYQKNGGLGVGLKPDVSQTVVHEEQWYDGLEVNLKLIVNLVPGAGTERVETALPKLHIIIAVYK